MSRIGKLPITIPSGVKIDIAYPRIKVTGPKGSLERDVDKEVELKTEDNQLFVTRTGETKRHRAIHGLMRSLLANMVTGVDQGFSKKLQVIGIGYRVFAEKDHLTLHLGFSNPVTFPIPNDIAIDVDKQNNMTITGIDKQLVGQVAANIRSIRPVEPYKGKGIRYDGESVRRKVGKTKTAKV